MARIFTRRCFSVQPDQLVQIAREEYGCELPDELANELAALFNAHAIPFQRHGSAADYFHTQYLWDRDIYSWFTAEKIRENEPAVWRRVLCLWLEEQLYLCGLIAPPPLYVPDDEGAHVVTAVFHVGFLTLPETEDMLTRLRRHRQAPAVSQVARSKFFNVLETRAVAPIDATAAKVSPGDAENKGE